MASSLSSDFIDLLRTELRRDDLKPLIYMCEWSKWITLPQLEDIVSNPAQILPILVDKSRNEASPPSRNEASPPDIFTIIGRFDLSQRLLQRFGQQASVWISPEVRAMLSVALSFRKDEVEIFKRRVLEPQLLIHTLNRSQLDKIQDGIDLVHSLRLCNFSFLNAGYAYAFETLVRENVDSRFLWSSVHDSFSPLQQDVQTSPTGTSLSVREQSPPLSERSSYAHDAQSSVASAPRNLPEVAQINTQRTSPANTTLVPAPTPPANTLSQNFAQQPDSTTRTPTPTPTPPPSAPPQVAPDPRAPASAAGQASPSSSPAPKSQQPRESLPNRPPPCVPSHVAPSRRFHDLGPAFSRDMSEAPIAYDTQIQAAPISTPPSVLNPPEAFPPNT